MSLSHCSRALREQARILGHPSLTTPSVAGLQRSVARWENAASPTLPDERYQLLLCCLYAHTPVGDVALGPGSDFAEVLHALEDLGIGQAALSALRSTVTRVLSDKGTGLISLLSPKMSSMLATVLDRPERVDEQLAADLQSAVASVGAQIDNLPFVRLQLMLTPIVEACRQLLALPLPEPIQSSVRRAITSAYTLAGRLAFELRDETASSAWYAAATHEAGLLAEPWRRANVHLAHAMVALHSADGHSRARVLTDAAVRDANRGQNTTVRAWSYAWQSAMAARSGEQRVAQGALGLAALGVDRAQGDGASPLKFEPWRLRAFEGVCELFVGEVASADAYLGQALQSRHLLLAERAILISDQALARLHLGDPRAAAELLHECIDMSPVGGRIPAVRLHWARKALSPWRHEQFVADFDDRLLDATLGAEGPARA